MLPERLLRPLTLQTPVTGADSRGQSVVVSWAESTITGRVDQTTRAEVTGDGRAASVTEWLLLTNSAAVTAHARVRDSAGVYAVVGRPQPVYRQTATPDHYEATLQLVEG